VALCDVDSKRGEAAAVCFANEYGTDRATFIKTDVTRTQNLEGQLNNLVVIVKSSLYLPTIIYIGHVT